MAQKRVLVIGAILLAAGIGAPTTAFLAPGGALSEPRTPEVEAPAPVPPQLQFESPASARPAPRRTAAVVVPPGTGTPPNPARTGPRRTEATVPPARPEPPRDLQPPTLDDQPQPPPPVEPTFQPDPAEVVLPPPPLPADDWDPADQ